MLKYERIRFLAHHKEMLDRSPLVRTFQPAIRFEISLQVILLKRETQYGQAHFDLSLRQGCLTFAR